MNGFPKITEEPSHPPISRCTTSCVFGGAVKVIRRNYTESDHNSGCQAEISFYSFQFFLPPPAEGADFKVETMKGFFFQVPLPKFLLGRKAELDQAWCLMPASLVLMRLRPGGPG